MPLVYERLPPGFLDAPPQAMWRVLGGPSLIHLPGRRSRPLFVSCLLHGNEWTGLQALQELLRRHRDRELPRALSIFVGNVEAAREGLRRIEGQPDYNRVWPDPDPAPGPEGLMMAQVVDQMARRQVFASVDIHNNTGINPHYACVNHLDTRFLHLATLFSRTVVYFTRPRRVQAMAMAAHCPAVTVECGQPGQDHGVRHALEYLSACLHLAELPEHPVAPHDIDLFHTVAIVRVPREVNFGFGACDAELCLEQDLDRLNFQELPAGIRLARRHPGSAARLEAWDNEGNEVADRFFDQSGDEIRMSRPAMPSMFTRDRRVIRQDCLGYLMERYPLP